LEIHTLLCHPECDIEKLKLFVYVLVSTTVPIGGELINHLPYSTVLYVTEELPHMIAQHEHDVLRRGLDPKEDSNPDTGTTVGVKVQFLRNARRGMMTLDPVDTPDILRILERYLMGYDSSEEDFATIEEYSPYRIPNAGYRYAILVI